MATIANRHRNEGERPYDPYYFAPFLRRAPQKTPARVSIDALQALLPPEYRDGQIIEVD